MNDISPTSTPAAVESPAPQAALATPTKAPRARTSLSVYLLGFWVLLLSFALVVACGWFYLDKQRQQQTLEQLQQQLGEQLHSQEESARALQESLEQELVDQQENMQANLNLLADELSKNSARVLALTSTSHDDWKLAEAQFLLRLANQRILFEKDSQNALALALSADNILRDLDQQELMAVRKILAEEIAVLKLAGVVDREGIFLRLAALANRIDAIPFIEPLGADMDVEEETEIPADETFKQKISRYFYGLLHKLGSYVRVRDHGKTVNAILPPSQQLYLQQNLRLMLEQAQVALLRNDAQIYQESLVKAQNWINQYYSLNAEASAVLAELQSLQNEEIAPELTDFHNAASSLTDYMARREQKAAARRGGR